MDKTILVNTDVHEDTKINNVTDGTCQYHARLEVFHFQHIRTQDRSRQVITRVTAGLEKLLNDILKRRYTNPTKLCRTFLAELGKAGLQILYSARGNVLFVVSTQGQQLPCCIVGLGVDTGIIKDFLTFRNPKEARALLERLWAKLRDIIQLTDR